MIMGKIKSIPFLYDWYIIAKSLGAEERLQLYDAILGYIYDDKTDVSDCTPLVRTTFRTMLPQIKREVKKVTDDLETETKKEKDTLFEECWVAYRRKGSKKKAAEYWSKLNDAEKSLVLPHIKAYVASRDIVYQKDFERYLRDKIFNTIVINGNKVVYDPLRNSTSAYTPSGWSIWYNNETKSYWSSDCFYDNRLYDGYTDDKRPDGATITLNNGRGTYRWDCLNKCWEKV